MKVSDGPSMMEEDEEVARLKSQVKEENFRPIFPFLLLPFCDSLTFFLAEIRFRWRRRSVNWATKMEGGKFISIVICCYCYFYFGIDVIGGQV